MNRDSLALILLTIPIFYPVIVGLGYDPIWFGVIIGMILQTSFLTPPFGLALSYLRSVAPPTIRTTDIYWGAVPFVVIQMIMVTLIIAFPSLVTLGLNRPVQTGQPAPIQLLAPDDQNTVNRDDAADLFRQLQPPTKP